ncbi:MAG: cation:proton antiporter family protein [Bacteroidales bacterium]|jgi:predicted Kef-type K+ transport protein|nr:cation:proton antiporter family protein [Bacteroidales bacterium]
MLDTWYLDAIWISVAFIGGLLARKINLPPLVGFLVAGFALNFAGFNSGGVALEAVSNLGVMLLLFTIGLKLNLRSLLAPEIWLATSIQMTLMSLFFGMVIFGLSFSGLHLLANIELTTALIIGFALSFSSTVFAIKILEDRGEVNSFHGKVTIGILVMQDIAAVLYLTITGQGELSLWLLALPFYLFIVRFILLKLINTIDHGELFTLFGFFAAFVAGAMSFKLFGLKADLGALIIGAILAPHERAKELARHMMGYKDFFLVAFFLQIGLSGFPSGIDLFMALILTLLLNFKGAFFMVLFTRFNLRARSSWLTSLSLTNYSEFGLIVISISAAEGLISEQWMTILALALSFSFLINSPLNTRAHQIFNKYRQQIAVLNKNCVHPDDELMDLGNTEYLICGMGRIGRVVYKHLREVHEDKVMGIDYDMELVERLQADSKNVFWGDATDSTFWENAKRSKIKMVFIAMSDHKSNVNVAKEISSMSERKFVAGATSKFKDEEAELKKAGADFVYNYYDRLGADFAERFVKIKDELTIDNSNIYEEA